MTENKELFPMFSFGIKKLGLTVGFLWTAIVLGSLYVDVKTRQEFTKELAIKEAKTHFHKDQAIRLWANSHGGVYVPETERTPANPYLEGRVEERDITTPRGKHYTLMNPAYLLRQLTADFSKEYGITGHLTSLKLLNPDNEPDDWERKALESFEKGVRQTMEFTHIGDKPYLRLMEPLFIKPSCLKCHSHQGYEIGDVRGGISISLPMKNALAEERKEILVQVYSHGAIWMFGIIGLAIGSINLQRQTVKRQAVEKERARLAAAIEQAVEAVIITDLDGTIQYVNPAMETITGYTREETIGKKTSILKSGKHDQAYYKDLWDTINQGKIWKGTFINKKKDGSMYDDETTITPIINASGEPISFVAVKRDVTSEMMLARAREYFTNVTSHELRTPIHKIQLMEHLLGDIKDHENAPKNLEKFCSILAEVRCSLDHILFETDLLTKLSLTQQEKSFSNIYLYQNLKSAIETTRMTIKKEGRKVVLHEDIEGMPVDTMILGDQKMLEIAFANLLSNAVKFTPDGKSIFVKAYKEGESAGIKIVDEGVGVPKEELQNIFEPYFSAENILLYAGGQYKFKAGGIGLGLTIARMIIDYHKGKLIITSEGKGQGTQVQLTFPVTKLS